MRDVCSLLEGVLDVNKNRKELWQEREKARLKLRKAQRALDKVQNIPFEQIKREAQSAHSRMINHYKTAEEARLRGDKKRMVEYSKKAREAKNQAEKSKETIRNLDSRLRIAHENYEKAKLKFSELDCQYFGLLGVVS